MIIHTTGTLFIFLSFCLFQFFLFCSAAILLYVVAVKIIDSLTAYCSAVLKIFFKIEIIVLAWEQSQMWNFIPFCCCCCCFIGNGNELSRKCMHIVIFYFFICLQILIDTKSIQKEINNLSGKLDRTFTVTDELIFRVRNLGFRVTVNTRSKHRPQV